MKYYVSFKDAPGMWFLFEFGDPVLFSATTEKPDTNDPNTSVLELASGIKVGVLGPHQLVFTSA